MDLQRRMVLEWSIERSKRNVGMKGSLSHVDHKEALWYSERIVATIGVVQTPTDCKSLLVGSRSKHGVTMRLQVRTGRALAGQVKTTDVSGLSKK